VVIGTRQARLSVIIWVSNRHQLPGTVRTGHAMLAPQASKIRSPSRPSSATRVKSFALADNLAVVIRASNCR